MFNFRGGVTLEDLAQDHINLKSLIGPNYEGWLVGLTLGQFRAQAQTNDVDEKYCWNCTWIVVDNVIWALGVFFQAYLKGGPNENSEGQWVPILVVDL